MLPAIANHLWQSTLFAGAVGLLTLVLRKNRAEIRHRLWLIASLKFLLPFSLVVGIGSSVEWRTAPAQPAIPVMLEDISQPFAHAAGRPPSVDIWPAVALNLWMAGSMIVVCRWVTRWRRVRSALRQAAIAEIGAPIKAMSSPGLLEPGVFGIFRPVLLLPEGITDRLTPAQLDAILAHELCHVRRRDNFFTAIHVLVEAIFWFHPFVWWIGARLVEERERACDEEVLGLGSDPQAYAEGILKVCRFYLEAPLDCVSGISGGGLKKRIEDIMTHGAVQRLDAGRRILLTALAMAAIAGPVAIGLMNAPPGRAQTTQGGTSGGAARLEFEVASIKPNQSGGQGFSAQHDAGRLTATNASLQNLIKMAYGLKNYQLSGAPGWLDSERFDVVAKAPPNTRRDQLNPMLQTLLVDRFKLAFHRETRVGQGYALVAARSGPKLHPSAAGENNFTGGRGYLSDRKISVSQLAESLSHLLDCPVADMTGIQGFFDLNLQWTPQESVQKPGEGSERPSPAPSDGPTIFTALEEQLGLKLEGRKVPVEILVIDHVEKTPSEN